MCQELARCVCARSVCLCARCALTWAQSVQPPLFFLLCSFCGLMKPSVWDTSDCHGKLTLLGLTANSNSSFMVISMVLNSPRIQNSSREGARLVVSGGPTAQLNQGPSSKWWGWPSQTRGSGQVKGQKGRRQQVREQSDRGQQRY